ncbi:MAG: hypothetical protein ACJ75F_05385 [Flavisolibacter sp.]|jgi:hypothetical protein
MEVKMFIHHTLDMVEKNVNDWLAQTKISIRHITQSQCERQGKFVFVMSVFYEKKEECVRMYAEKDMLNVLNS